MLSVDTHRQKKKLSLLCVPVNAFISMFLESNLYLKLITACFSSYTQKSQNRLQKLKDGYWDCKATNLLLSTNPVHKISLTRWLVWWTKNKDKTSSQNKTEEYIIFNTKKAIPKAISGKEIENASESDPELKILRKCIKLGHWQNCLNTLLKALEHDFFGFRSNVSLWNQNRDSKKIAWTSD